MLRTRSLRPELIDAPDFPPEEMARVHRDIVRVHGMLGSFPTVERFLRADDLPVRRVLDVGCGNGALLAWLRTRMNVEVIGVDTRPDHANGVPILTKDATTDTLPEADVAVSLLVTHHLTPEQNVAMIRNVGRSCRRFLILDLIRHPLPFCLFTLFLCPAIGRIAAVDGRQSIRRAYTPDEFAGLVRTALDGHGQARFTADVSPWLSRQVTDIRFR